MSHNTKSSKYLFQNGQYLGDYYKKSKFLMSETVKGRSMNHTVEELICYRIRTLSSVNIQVNDDGEALQ